VSKWPECGATGGCHNNATNSRGARAALANSDGQIQQDKPVFIADSPVFNLSTVFLASDLPKRDLGPGYLWLAMADEAVFPS